MPQATDELRKLVRYIVQIKPDVEVVNDFDVNCFLEERGYFLNSDWTWKLPSPTHIVSDMEELCLRYLIDEWDYGGVQ